MTAVDKSATMVTDRLVVSSLRPEDADEMADVLRDDLLHEFTGGRPLTLDELRRRYRRLAVGALQMASRRGSIGWNASSSVGSAPRSAVSFNKRIVRLVRSIARALPDQNVVVASRRSDDGAAQRVTPSFLIAFRHD